MVFARSSVARELKGTSDCFSGRQPIAKAFRSDIEGIAYNLPPIQFGNRE